MSGRRYLQVGQLGVYRSHRSLVIRWGRWACHYSRPTRAGRYGNGSGWHDWTIDNDIMPG